MIIIGPTLKSGIGQHAKKYTNLFPDAEYYTIGSHLPEMEYGLIFTIPTDVCIEYVKYAKTRIRKLACMTVCETETVHEDYGLLFKEFETIFVPSEFCKKVLSRQFPDTTFKVIHAHIPVAKKRPYVFYHIGNIMDPRKNFKKIIEAFVRMNDPNTRLLVKATCNQDVDIQLPRVEVINGLLSDEKMSEIHDMGDCYVSFSHSEGVGMGAVEAALRNKPVIIADYGGAPEYIKTPYTINCELQQLEKDDFLFKKGMYWGNPNFDQLLEFMKHARNNNVLHMDHSHTRQLVSKENVLREFVDNIISDKNDDTREKSTRSE